MTLASFSSVVMATTEPEITKFVKVSGTDAMFVYDIYTNLNYDASYNDLEQIDHKASDRLCNVIKSWKLEMIDGQILSKVGKSISSFSLTKWDC